jgi:hypothetical protein
MMRALYDSPYDVFVIGVGAEIDRGELKAIGRTGTLLVADSAAAQQAFSDIAQRIEAITKRYYLLSYCSPARAGEHQLAIEASLPDGSRGRLTDQFNAAGFGPNCDPRTPPAFDTSLRHARVVH